MPYGNSNILQYKPGVNPILKLVLDDKTAVGISDKPIFGNSVTISEQTKLLIGRLLMPGVVIGWVNYIDVNKFACMTSDNRYIEASQFICTQNNQIVLTKPLKILSVNDEMMSSKQILTFQET